MKTVSPFILLVSIMLIFSSAKSFSFLSITEDETVQEENPVEVIESGYSNEPQMTDSTESIKHNIRNYISEISYFLQSY